jgi:hypothetical protein
MNVLRRHFKADIFSDLEMNRTEMRFAWNNRATRGDEKLKVRALLLFRLKILA